MTAIVFPQGGLTLFVGRLIGIVAALAGTFNPTDLPMGETFTISSLTFRFGTLTFNQTAPKTTRPDLEQVVKTVVHYLNTSLPKAIEFISSRM